jgi:hypothetical protein
MLVASALQGANGSEVGGSRLLKNAGVTYKATQNNKQANSMV